MPLPETFADDDADDRADYRAGREVGKPMDGHGHANADIERVN